LHIELQVRRMHAWKEMPRNINGTEGCQNNGTHSTETHNGV
jgi:hypothetical protein